MMFEGCKVGDKYWRAVSGSLTCKQEADYEADYETVFLLARKLGL